MAMATKVRIFVGALMLFVLWACSGAGRDMMADVMRDAATTVDADDAAQAQDGGSDGGMSTAPQRMTLRMECDQTYNYEGTDPRSTDFTRILRWRFWYAEQAVDGLVEADVVSASVLACVPQHFGEPPTTCPSWGEENCSGEEEPIKADPLRCRAAQLPVELDDGMVRVRCGERVEESVGGEVHSLEGMRFSAVRVRLVLDD